MHLPSHRIRSHRTRNRRVHNLRRSPAGPAEEGTNPSMSTVMLSLHGNWRLSGRQRTRAPQQLHQRAPLRLTAARRRKGGRLMPTWCNASSRARASRWLTASTIAATAVRSSFRKVWTSLPPSANWLNMTTLRVCLLTGRLLAAHLSLQEDKQDSRQRRRAGACVRRLRRPARTRRPSLHL